MQKVIDTEKIPVKLWLDDIEDTALQQAKNLANLPFAFKWIAIMPDSHQGYGMPIGGVMATKNVVVPNAVGVDIGCGMCSMKTDLKEIDVDNLKKIMGKIRETIPVGFSHLKEKQESELYNDVPDVDIVHQEIKSSMFQLGTLGGGNHFIEIQRGSDDFIYAMIHSGSRNFGLKIANEYHNKAKELCETWYSNIPDKDLAFLPQSSAQFHEYLSAMNFALKFAKENRKRMMIQVKQAFKDVLNLADVFFSEPIDIHHNYAQLEHHFGENVIVHRKGATSARKDEIGLIPGSQGTKSYIVRGLGNPESFASCSHGAGRKLGRKQAQKTLDLETEKKLLDDQGIVHSIRNIQDLDEAAGAYKDISVVMAMQADLVEIVTELSPLAVIKA